MEIELNQKLLGKLPARKDPRDLKLGNYTSGIRKIPTFCNWVSNKINNWQMYGNDRYGDCVMATKAHQLMSWHMDATGENLQYTTEAVVDEYFKLSGGRDSGLNINDSLNWWKNKGLLGHKIDGYVSVEEHNLDLLKLGIYLFGGMEVGIAVYPQYQSGEPIWTATSGRSIGGHSIPLLGYDTKKKTFKLCSWSKIYEITFDSLLFSIDEAFCPLSKDWIKKSGKAPNGFDLVQLNKDLESLK